MQELRRGTAQTQQQLFEGGTVFRSVLVAWARCLSCGDSPLACPHACVPHLQHLTHLPQHLATIAGHGQFCCM